MYVNTGIGLYEAIKVHKINKNAILLSVRLSECDEVYWVVAKRYILELKCLNK